MIGSLIYSDYKKLIQNKHIVYKKISYKQIQPSSIDLTLSNECYEIKHSFLSPNTTVRNKLQSKISKKIDLSKYYLFKKNKTYLVKINEMLNLDKNIFGHCNPKSSTGRLDIFCRSIVNFSDEYEKIPKNYSGEIFLEITTRSFNVKLKEGDSLNQLRLIFKKNNFLKDSELKRIHNKNKIIFKAKENLDKIFNNGVKISVNLSNDEKVTAFKAKKNTEPILFNKINYYKIEDYWAPISCKNKNLVIQNNNFYILRSKEKIKIPSSLAGEMIPYDTGIGDFRAHYAGFFDPGFGDPNGSFAVLEVKTNEIPFVLEDGQTIARIKYEKLNKNSNVVYGKDIKSNYQYQGLALSKNFKKYYE